MKGKTPIYTSWKVLLLWKEGLVKHISRFSEVEKIVEVHPVLPIVSGKEKELPFFGYYIPDSL